MYGINEFLVLQRFTENMQRSAHLYDQARWIREADRDDRRKRRRWRRRQWTSFLSLFLF